MNASTSLAKRWRRAGIALTLGAVGWLVNPAGAATTVRGPSPLEPAADAFAGATTTTRPATVGGYTNGGAKKPGAPQLETTSGTRTLSRSEIDALVAKPNVMATQCTVDFNDPIGKSVLPGGGLDTFIPWWSQGCGAYGVRAFPLDYGHFHLGYADPDVGVCVNPDNSHDTPIGEFSRGEDCEPIDPVAEERSHVTAHDSYQRIRVDADGDTFSVKQVRIRYAGTKVCYRRAPAPGEPWEAAEVGLGDGPGQSYCWANLAPGLWDLTDWAFGINALTTRSATGVDTPHSIDDIKIA